MEIIISEKLNASEIIVLIKEAKPGSIIVCQSERMFSLTKIVVVKLKKTELSIHLIDDEGYVTRKVVAQRKQSSRAAPGSSVAPEETKPKDRLSAPQMSAVRLLEDALRRCAQQKLLLVGFSDGLVAVPEHLGSGADILSSTIAHEVDAHDVYRGFDPEYDDE